MATELEFKPNSLALKQFTKVFDQYQLSKFLISTNYIRISWATHLNMQILQPHTKSNESEPLEGGPRNPHYY